MHDAKTARRLAAVSQLPIPWDEGSWLNPPAATDADGSDLVVTAVEGSDFWRTTSYGFVHDDGHGLLRPLATGQAAEVTFVADLDEQFDQAGILLRVDAARWVKAGLERSDGALQLGAVVTDGMSDWSVAPVPDWAGRRVTVRASLGADAVTVRAWCDGAAPALVRVAPLTGRPVMAGPMVCAPTRAGLKVRFTSWTEGPADASLHP